MDYQPLKYYEPYPDWFSCQNASPGGRVRWKVASGDVNVALVRVNGRSLF